MASRDWTSLPRDILAEILQNFHTLDEYLVFGRVCKEWCLVVKGQNWWRELSKSPVPFLMVPSRDEPINMRSFYSVVDNKLVCDLQITLQYDRRCCGSSHGWLATLGADMVIMLRNLFSGRCIYLPPIFSNPPCDIVRDCPVPDHSYWISKVILSEDPDDSSPESCIVGVLYGSVGWLAFMRLCEEGWTYVDPRLTYLFFDIIFYDGYLYAIEDRGKLLRIDVSIGSYVDKEEGEIVVPRSFKEQASRAYIVQSCQGKLLMIRRFVDIMLPVNDVVLYFTTRFDVFKLTTSSEGSSWVEIKSLGDEILFLGDSHSMSVTCSNSNLPGYKPNRIYFSDDAQDYDLQGPTDIGVYNIEHRSVEATYTPHPFETQLPPSIFIVPKLDDKLFLK